MSESKPKGGVFTLNSSLTEKRKAVLQRFLIERVCGHDASRTFHKSIFSNGANDFDKPHSFAVKHLVNWSRKQRKFLKIMNGIQTAPYLASLKNDSSGDPTITLHF